MSFSEEGAFVELNRKGRVTLVDPFGKVRKRARNGEIDQLLALVDLVEHVAPPLPAAVVCADALRALEATSPREPPGINGLRFMAYAALALIVLPLVILVVLLLTIDTTYALIGGACGVPLGLVALVVALGTRRPKQPVFPRLSLAWEAQLTLPPLMNQLTRKLNELGPQSHQRALDEIAFYTAQLREVQAVVDARDVSPGRGHIGYRSFGAPRGPWAER